MLLICIHEILRLTKKKKHPQPSVGLFYYDGNVSISVEKKNAINRKLILELPNASQLLNNVI